MNRKKKILEERDSLELKQRDLIGELELIEEKRVADTAKLEDIILEQFDNEYFVGVVLTLDDVFDILKDLQKNNTVRIPFKLYN